MRGKSNSFLQVTPFKPRSGLIGGSYIAFPIDTREPRGCLDVTPMENFIAEDQPDDGPVD